MDTRRLGIVGGGMAAHRLVEALLDRDTSGSWSIDLFAEERFAPYDRVALTSYFEGRGPDALLLAEPTLWEDTRVRLHTGAEVTALDPGARTVTAAGEPRISAMDGHFLHGTWTLGTSRSSAKARHLAALANADRRLVRVEVVDGPASAPFEHGAP